MACLYFRIFTEYQLKLNQTKAFTNHWLEKFFTNELKVSSRGEEIHFLPSDKETPSFSSRIIPLTIIPDIVQEAPLFRFYLRPWKVETAIRTTEACKVKQGRPFFKKKIHYLCF